MFTKVLVANRGAIAVRIIRTLHAMNIDSVAVYAESDRDSAHVEHASEAYSLGEGGAADTYLNVPKLLEIILATGSQAVHPGYGFLSENVDFARSLKNNGVAFIGPRTEHIEQFGLKHEARRLAEEAGVNLLPGSGILDDASAAQAAAEAIGYPIMLKSTAGGGGIGMQRCDSSADLASAFSAVQRLAQGNFGNAEVFIEKLLIAPRHVEVQAFGDGQGGVAIIGDRDCSLQRRHQKVIEECPAPNIPDAVRGSLHAQARQLLASVGYANAGTVEFLYDAAAEQFHFLEVNTRLQVEHGVTELVYDIDLVEWMVRLASDEVDSLDPLNTARPEGHAVQARVYAEDPKHDFRPTPGHVAVAQFPSHVDVRVDTWLHSGTDVPFAFDPMLAKIIAHDASRDGALHKLDQALADTAIYGIETNCLYLRQVIGLEAFRDGAMSTATLAEHVYTAPTFDVLAGGANTTVQSYPGRQGYWEVGVPPSGPMDDLSFRLGNRLLNNPAEAAGLEIVMNGPRLMFNCAAECVVTGAEISVQVDGDERPMWSRIALEAGQTLTLGTATRGLRAYLLIKDGIDVPLQMGSTATFDLGGMGGHNGRQLRVGDVLHIDQQQSAETPGAFTELTPALRPSLDDRLQLRVLLGPHTAPDFFTEADIETLVTSDWTVHYNSSRTGVRLTGPQPQWARPDGGEAGLHPSNIHDNAYAFGSVDFTGDMPVILGPDGPSLGGFVCPFVVANADRWKLGQLTPGDRIKFVPISERDANRIADEQDRLVKLLVPTEYQPQTTRESPIVRGRSVVPGEADLGFDDVTIRRAGQEWLLVEFGPAVLDIVLRLKVHALVDQIQSHTLSGIVEMTPGIRSLQIRFDRHVWSAGALCERLQPILDRVAHGRAPVIESRTVRLPLSWEDPACLEAVDRYVQGVRADAPWCPDNVEFIRRINGLESKDDVKRIVFDARYLVMGLGDVYLGAPVATPLDPRHRLVTTKYNPARTWTAENSVGIGGSYLCIYGMEGPGGYQFVGRTLQVWNSQQRGPAFDKPWLLRPFDRLQFYEVDAPTLLDMRDAFARGALAIDIEPTTFDPAAYESFLAREKTSIHAFTQRRQAAFDAELARWREQGLLSFETEPEPQAPAAEYTLPEGAVAVDSPMSGSVWSLPTATDQWVDGDDTLVVLEAMKSEFEVKAPVAGRVEYIVKPGQSVQAGQLLAVVTP